MRDCNIVQELFTESGTPNIDPNGKWVSIGGIEVYYWFCARGSTCTSTPLRLKSAANLLRKKRMMACGRKHAFSMMLVKMEESQMQELFHDEQTQSVPTTIVFGQSQTRSAQYARNYRKNPEKNRKINEDRRRNYKMKKEGKSKISSLFMESGAASTTIKPQTIEKTLSRSDSPSLPKLQGEASGELSDSSQSYCHEDQTTSVVTRRSENVFEEKTNNLDIQNQAELLLEIRDCLIDLRESVKPAAQSMSVEQEQQAIVGGIANANSGKLPKTADSEKHDFLSGVLSQLAKLDGAAFIRNFPAALALGYFAYLACGFVIDQTLPLYRSLNFPMPEIACSGAIGLAIGFSALSAISKSNLAKIFIAIMAAYELILVFAGSQANQADIALQALRDNPEHFEASQSYAIAKGDFERYNANYGSNNSKMFQNAWYRENYVDPAREKLSAAVAKLKSIEENFKSEDSRGYWELVLKVLYRLSAVAFVMLLAKESMRRAGLSLGTIHEKNGFVF